MTGAKNGNVVRLVKMGDQIREGFGRVDAIDGTNRGQFTGAQKHVRQRFDAGGLAELARDHFQVTLG